jgi:type I restriction-modification system DNA methylase subunit
MSLFQTSVVKKYLNDLSPELIDKKYKAFQDYFGNSERQENIRNSKEEEYQSGFVSALFVNILEYTLNPEPNFNFVLEKKNVDDSKKADGAILKDENVVAVIELKSTQTTDLGKVETQAFGYKVHNPKCQYVITSNFEKIRFYIQNTTEHLEYDLFNLSKEDFAMLWLCLSKDNILSDIPLKIKEASVLQEENVTKQLYNDYSKFRKEIFDNIVKNNTEFDKLVLFKKTQKLLDRFLFIFFAEDKLLLPPNSISEIVKQWITLKDDLDEYVPLYDRFKKYFGYLNTGFKGKKYDIFAYNGGLFLPDEILDNIKIDDEILHQNTLQLSTYDFETEVDVNILGHIFEHSLSEIENVQAEIVGEEVDRQKTKRKKDGIFYTPKYITKYIVENTVGKLCEEKQNEFGIIDEEYAKGRKNRKKDIVRDLDNKLIKYREWLLEITILDPACGSGAFLNQALEFLINEHKKIDELKAQLLGGSIIFPDIEAKILEKNIYGVDLNEESVEIAKLSLWLRTAQKGRKLTTLSNHIKCGNSLIDDTEVAGEKAFNWKNEFPEVFEKGGFDVVIGNPPYLAGREWSDELSSQRSYFKKTFSCMTDQYDLYALFIQKCHELVQNKGYFSFIVPITWFNNEHYLNLRKWVLNEYDIVLIGDYKDINVFKDATVLTSVFVFSKINAKSNDKIKIETFLTPSLSNIKYSSQKLWKKLDNNLFNTELTKEDYKLLQKIDSVSLTLNKIGDIKFGVKVYQKGKGKPKQDGSEAPVKKFETDNKVDESYYKYLHGKDINSFYCKKDVTYLKYGLHLAEPRTIELFQKGRILVRRIVGKRLIVCPVNETMIADQLLHTFKPFSDDTNYKAIACILSSSLIAFYFRKSFNRTEKTFPEIRVKELASLPIIKTKNINSFEPKADTLLLLRNQIIELEKKFIKLLKSNTNDIVISKKIQTFYEYDFKTLLSELKKQKIRLSLSEQAEWNDFFEQNKKEINQLQVEISKTNKEIDQMVYELYGLTEEEIKIAEETN